MTGLVRFGFRDYEPTTGRWTAMDPGLFATSPDNLYAHAANNPVSLALPRDLDLVELFDHCSYSV